MILAVLLASLVASTASVGGLAYAKRKVKLARAAGGSGDEGGFTGGDPYPQGELLADVEQLLLDLGAAWSGAASKVNRDLIRLAILAVKKAIAAGPEGELNLLQLIGDLQAALLEWEQLHQWPEGELEAYDEGDVGLDPLPGVDDELNGLELVPAKGPLTAAELAAVDKVLAMKPLPQTYADDEGREWTPCLEWWLGVDIPDWPAGVWPGQVKYLYKPLDVADWLGCIAGYLVYAPPLYTAVHVNAANEALTVEITKRLTARRALLRAHTVQRMAALGLTNVAIDCDDSDLDDPADDEPIDDPANDEPLPPDDGPCPLAETFPDLPHMGISPWSDDMGKIVPTSSADQYGISDELHKSALEWLTAAWGLESNDPADVALGNGVIAMAVNQSDECGRYPQSQAEAEKTLGKITPEQWGGLLLLWYTEYMMDGGSDQGLAGLVGGPNAPDFPTPRQLKWGRLTSLFADHL